MTTPGRKRLLCAQAAPPDLTGIDFIWVNPSDHRELAVFFVIEPDQLARPFAALADELSVQITGLEDGREIGVVAQDWVARIDATGTSRRTLTLMAEMDGGFQTYRLALTDTPADAGPSRLDPFSDQLDFSFKQACPSPFDCKPGTDCPPPETEDYPVDYLARDFESLRAALSDFARARYPDWQIDTPADFGAAMAEIFAALGDEFAYIQDAIAREGYIDTLRERRSLSHLARLLDYRPDPGTAATGLVIMRLYSGTIRPPGTVAELISLPPGVRIWADQQDGPPLGFEVGDDIAQMVAGTPRYPLHTHWTDLAVYQPDPAQPCLQRGARSLMLDNADLLRPPLPPEALAGGIEAYWVGRQLLIETRPSDPAEPVRRHLVTLDAPPEQMQDPLTGAGPLTRLHWRAEDALPFGLDQGAAFVSANLVPVRAGLTRTEDFVTGVSDAAHLAALPRTLEREGPMDAQGARAVIHRHSIAATALAGLDWSALPDPAGAARYAPQALLRQLDPVAVHDPTTIAEWRLGDTPLALGPTEEAATIEPGLYAPVARFERRGRELIHHDYVGDPGYGLRFGDGQCGRLPPEGARFRLFWRSNPGAAANLAADTLTRLDAPTDAPAALRDLPAQVASVRNPFASQGGRGPISLERARRIAPAAFSAEVLRAVRDQDYRAQAERLDWVEAAGAVTRWTGAWATTFVSADPRGAFEISPARMRALRTRLDAVRQVGRPVIARQPVFIPLDLRIALCVTPGFAFGDVAARVIAALGPQRGGFFHPDRFTFGKPLRRADLEAAIAAVEGVRAVFDIAIRQRGQRGWALFDSTQIPAAENRILKVENDPTRPGQGSIRVYRDHLPDLAEALP